MESLPPVDIEEEPFHRDAELGRLVLWICRPKSLGMPAIADCQDGEKTLSRM